MVTFNKEIGRANNQVCMNLIKTLWNKKKEKEEEEKASEAEKHN